MPYGAKETIPVVRVPLASSLIRVPVRSTIGVFWEYCNRHIVAMLDYTSQLVPTHVYGPKMPIVR